MKHIKILSAIRKYNEYAQVTHRPKMTLKRLSEKTGYSLKDFHYWRFGLEEITLEQRIKICERLNYIITPNEL